MLYDRPVKDLLADALDEPYTRDVVRSWFGVKYPKVQPSTLWALMSVYNANNRNRRRRPSSRRKSPLVFKLSSGNYVTRAAGALGSTAPVLLSPVEAVRQSTR